jgi:DNA (cytosine-5)-methyltransferase 1
MPKNKPLVLDLFSGVGGLSLGFQQAGFDIALAIEVDSEISDSYKKNHSSVEMITDDITQLDIHDIFSSYIGIVDVIVGGPPCQGFSQKGKRRSINDNRNFLFKYYYNIVRLIKPKYFLMENVPNLLTTGQGYFKKEIDSLFKEIGYSLSADVLRASDFGIPQERCRAVILGKHSSIPLALPTAPLKKISIWDAISDLSYLDSSEGEFEQDYRLPPKTNYQKTLRNSSRKLYNHQATKHSRIALERMCMIPHNCTQKVLPVEHQTKSIYSGTWTRMSANETAVTITTRFDTPSSGQFTHPFLDRAITVREAARIQSFPDSFIFYGTKSSQMKQVGNAVPPLLANSIARQIMVDITKEKIYGKTNTDN